MGTMTQLKIGAEWRSMCPKPMPMHLDTTTHGRVQLNPEAPAAARSDHGRPAVPDQDSAWQLSIRPAGAAHRPVGAQHQKPTCSPLH
mmetsp:Transcript_11357/g.19885  ORF Transcript_11357/g.19885 Transcript_11357/m.19885 type:complete len:87 (-) Transcript_11357:1415-1675(-)